MKTIRENIVGLVRFIGILFSLCRPRAKPQTYEIPGELREEKKYEALVGHSKSLFPVGTKFCPKCHVAIAQVRHTDQGTQIIQHGKVLVTVGGNIITTKEGRETKGFPIKCPNGHAVRIE